MEDQQFDFKPIEFSKTSHDKLRPPLFDGDHVMGEDYVVGRLLSLHYGKNALLFVGRFTPGPDAKKAGCESLDGEAEFLLIKRKGRYLGSITRQAPLPFLRFSAGEEVSTLDGLGHDGPGLGGREAAHFWCSLNVGETWPRVTVSVYIRLGWFDRWKEVVVKMPKKELYVARP